MKISYEAIEAVNAQIKPTQVKGKKYAAVADRIIAFRKVCPGGSIESDIVNLNGNAVIIKSTVKDDEGKVLGTGYAREKEGSSYINKTSYIENAETSAVGRALGMCGIGTNLDSLASAEEIANAQLNQQEQVSQQKQSPRRADKKGNQKSDGKVRKKLSQQGIQILIEMLAEEKRSLESVMEEYHLKQISDFPLEEYVKMYRKHHPEGEKNGQ